MMRLLILVIHQLHVMCCKFLSSTITKLLLKFYGAKYGKGFLAIGIPYIYISRSGTCKIGNQCMIASSRLSSISGAEMKTKIEIRYGATLTLGNNVGISGGTLFCEEAITVDDNVKIGFGTHIYDTDFHSLDAKDRLSKEDARKAKKKPVHIGKNVFVGTQCIILKGVNIGDNAVIAAGSVVVKDIPANEVWGGNPAKFIRKI